MRLRTRLTIIPLLALLTLGTVACEKKTTRKLLRYNSAVTAATIELQFQAIDAYAKQEIGVNEARGIVTGTTQVLRVSRELNDFLAGLDELSPLDAPNNRAHVLNLILQLTDSVRQLGEDGVLRIKNNESRDAFNKILISIEGFLAVMQGVLQ